MIFTAAAAVVFGVETLLTLAIPVAHGREMGEYVLLPLLGTLIYAFVSADTSETPPPESAIWERFLERAWAVIVIDFITTQIAGVALGGTAQTPEALALIAGLLAFGLSVLLVFADASATVDEDVTVWNVIPRAFLQSVATTWNPTTFVRALAIFSFQLAVLVLEITFYALLNRGHVAQAEFWAEVPLLTLTQIPLSALTVLVYRDARALVHVEHDT